MPVALAWHLHMYDRQLKLPLGVGDSLLFAAGAFCATGALQLGAVLATFITAAILGDALNYTIGHSLGASSAGLVTAACCVSAVSPNLSPRAAPTRMRASKKFQSACPSLGLCQGSCL